MDKGLAGAGIIGLLALVAVGPLSAAAEEVAPGYSVNHINPEYALTAQEAYEWHAYKDEGGPTFSGSPSWKRYLAFLETKLEEYGAVDFVKNTWTYDRWYTSEWPDDSKWSLRSDGKAVKVASYGTYSGSTGSEGTTAQLIFYDPDNPPESIEGKIVVFKTEPGALAGTLGDYEFRLDPERDQATGDAAAASRTTSALIFAQLVQTVGFIRTLTEGRAAGGLFVFDASYDQLAGMYTFPVPSLYNAPSLYLDRRAGASVIEDAKKGKTATLTLLATLEPAETYQLIAYLPGKHYGTPEDEKILMTTHTDGPSISQDNGALGILAVVHYFSHIPRAERPRTLMVFLDNRHYMPGMERVFAKQSWFAKESDPYKSVAAVVGIEHLGQIEYRELGGVFEPTGLVDPSRLYVTNNQTLVDLAIKAVKDNNFRGASVSNVDRPGIEGKPQGRWYGLGAIARRQGLPGFATMGSMGAYWATTARIEHFDKDHFVVQVATMTQLTGELMKASLDAIATEK